MQVRDIVDRVLEDLHFIGLLHQAPGADADLALATGGHLVVMHLDIQAHLLECFAHRAADVLEGIDRGHREVAALDAGAMTHVAFRIGGVGIPRPLHRVDLVAAAVHAIGPLHAVENEEFILGAKERPIGDAGGLQIRLGAPPERARIAPIALHRRRFNHIAADVDRRVLEKRINARGRGIGHQDHVRLIDPLPARDRGAVEHLALDKQLIGHIARRNRDVLFFAARVREAQIRILEFFLFDQLDDITRSHIPSRKNSR